MSKISVILLFGILMMNLSYGHDPTSDCLHYCDTQFSTPALCYLKTVCLDATDYCVCMWSYVNNQCENSAVQQCQNLNSCSGTDYTTYKCNTNDYDRYYEHCIIQNYYPCNMGGSCVPGIKCQGCTLGCDTSCTAGTYVECLSFTEHVQVNPFSCGRLNCESSCGASPECDELDANINTICLTGTGKACTNCHVNDLDTSGNVLCGYCGGVYSPDVFAHTMVFESGTTASCCGDDSGENYIRRNVRGTLSDVWGCCNNANDCIYGDSSCKSEGVYDTNQWICKANWWLGCTGPSDSCTTQIVGSTTYRCVYNNGAWGWTSNSIVGIENNAANCADSYDNDCDGTINCADNNCCFQPFCCDQSSTCCYTLNCGDASFKSWFVPNSYNKFTSGTPNCCGDDAQENFDGEVGSDGDYECCSDAVFANAAKPAGPNNCPEFKDLAIIPVILGIIGSSLFIRKRLR